MNLPPDIPAVLAGSLSEFPPGRVFQRDPASLLAAVFNPPAAALTRARRAVLQLVNTEADPAAAIQLLPEWENDYGLPDPCTPATPTLQQRRAALLAKIAATGGQSPGYFVSVAAAMGYSITITQYKPFRFGESRFGDLLLSPGWQFVWQVNAPTVHVRYFTFGQSGFGEAFWKLDATDLECRLRAIAPAHTILNFVYS